MSRVPLADVEHTLAGLWDATQRKDAHASLFTLVAFCATPDELPRVRAALPSVVASHPCRTLTITCYPDGAPSITARVSLHVDTSRKNEPVGEDVDLDVRGDARTWVPSTLVRLRQSDAPLYVWWVGDLPDDDRLFDHLLEQSDVAIVHTSDMDLRDLEQLSRLVEASNGATVMADLTWMRLRAWQEFTARFFDDPAARASLPRVRGLTVRFAPRDREPEAASTQAALFAGWACTALGWDARAPKYHRDGEAYVATIADRAGAPVTVRFVADEREGVYYGAIFCVTLTGDGVHFDVTRSDDDPLVLCWKAEAPDLVVPSQCVRIGTPDEPKMLSRTLDRPRNDQLFNRSLAAAAALMAPVSARRA